MNHDLEIQRLASRTAFLLVVPAWSGFIYELLRKHVRVSLPQTTSLPELSCFTIGAIIISLICFACALPTIRDDIGSPSAWLFVLVCAIPFFGMLWLLDPLGVTAWYGHL